MPSWCASRRSIASSGRSRRAILARPPLPPWARKPDVAEPLRRIETQLEPSAQARSALPSLDAPPVRRRWRVLGRRADALAREFQPGTAEIETAPTPLAATATLFVAVG